MSKNSSLVTRYRQAVENFLRAFEALNAASNEYSIRQPELHDDDIAALDITAAEFEVGANSISKVLTDYVGTEHAKNIYLLRL